MIPGTGDAAGTALEELRAWLPRLATHDGAGLSEAELIDHLALMERLKSGLAAAQARLTTTLADTRAAREAATGVPADQVAAAWLPRSGWPAGRARSVALGVWASPGRWSTSSRTRSPP